MKIRYVYFILSLLLLPIGVNGQEIDGSVRIRSLKMEKIENDLCLSFDVWVDRQAMNFRQSWSVVPELIPVGQTSGFRFPRLLINGRQKERHYRRKLNFENIELLDDLPKAKTYIVKHTDTTLTYVSQIPYAPWMDNSVLQLNQLLRSSRNKKQLFVIEDYKRMESLPEVVPMPLPTHVPVKPEPIVRQYTVEAAARLDYPVGDAQIHPHYRNNPKELENIEAQFEEIRKNRELEIQSVRLQGYASPEGSYGLNERLARERVEGFKTYLSDRLNIPMERIEVISVAEDWEGFRTLVDGKNLPGKQEILAIIDSGDAPDEKERKLRRHPQWQTLLRDVFPHLRRTEYQIQISVTTTVPE